MDENDTIGFTLLKIGGSYKKADIKSHRTQYNCSNGKQGNHFAGEKIEACRMLIVSIACWMYAIAVILIRTRAIILERERHTAWVGQLQETAQ